jgi:hypothetical protein
VLNVKYIHVILCRSHNIRSTHNTVYTLTANGLIFDLYFTVYQRRSYILTLYARCVAFTPSIWLRMWPGHVTFTSLFEVVTSWNKLVDKRTTIYLSITYLLGTFENCEKRLIASSLFSIRPSVCRPAWKNSTFI